MSVFRDNNLKKATVQFCFSEKLKPSFPPGPAFLQRAQLSEPFLSSRPQSSRRHRITQDSRSFLFDTPTQRNLLIPKVSTGSGKTQAVPVQKGWSQKEIKEL